MTPFLQFILVLAVVILFAKLSGYLVTKIGLPAVTGEILGGLLLGPTLIDFVHIPAFTDVHLQESITFIAELGVLLLMFIAGLNLHVSDLAKSGKLSLLAGTIGFILPIGMGIGLALLFDIGLEQAIFFGLMLAPTSVSISAQTLMELGVLRSRVGVGLLGAAVVDDALVVVALSLFLALAGGAADQGGAAVVFNVLLKETLFIVLATFVGIFLLPKLIELLDRMEISQGKAAFVIVVILLFSWTAEYLGQLSMIIGSFMAGLFFGRTRVKERIEESLSPFAYGFFVPVFFMNVGLSVDMSHLPEGSLLLILLTILVAVISKILGVGLGGWLSGLKTDELVKLGVGMVPRGEVGLIVAATGLASGALDQLTFSSGVTTVIITTLIVPPILRLLFQRKKIATEKPRAAESDA